MNNRGEVRDQRITKNESGRIAVALAWIAGLTAISITALYTVFGTVVPPDKIGVRKNYFSFGVLDEGYVAVGLEPGLHLKFPKISEIILLPRGFQIVNLSRDGDGDEKGDLDLDSLEVPTTDGSKVNTDVSLLVRLYERPVEGAPPVPAPAKPDRVELTSQETPQVPLAIQKVRSHGGPEQLITSYRDRVELQLQRFVQIAQDELRRTMSELSTTDFYDPTLREHAAFVAHEAINSKTNAQGIELWGTLVRRYTYADAEIDQRIFQKNLQFQTEKFRAASTKFTEAEADIRKTEARWQAKIQDIVVAGQNYVTRAESDARLYEETKIAEGERTLKTQQAEVTSAQNRLLASMPGANLYLAREMVPLLRTLGGGVVANLDPYDIDSWVKKLTGVAVPLVGGPVVGLPERALPEKVGAERPAPERAVVVPAVPARNESREGNR